MAHQPRFSFPDGKRLAVSIHFPVEWWLEPHADPQARYYQEYGAKTGAWRLLDMFDRVGVRATSHMNGVVGELFPELAREIVDRGHDIAGHSYDQSHPQFSMPCEEERLAVRKTLDMIETASGLRPRCWVSSGRRTSENTVRILVEEKVDWHSHHDLGDLPSIVTAGDGTIVDVPIQRYMNYNERKLMGRAGDQFRSCKEIVEFFKSQLDAMRGAAQYEPLCFQFGAHAHMSGLPAYAWGVQEMIHYALSFEDVWFVTTGDLARYWRDHNAD
ncbi:MAG: polysaccharide deacetylase family protein [Alphaproteobacteria bacterium]|nr:polysaccharide deacetylase family protein [Alphaproteobacteria bacterium]